MFLWLLDIFWTMFDNVWLPVCDWSTVLWIVDSSGLIYISVIDWQLCVGQFFNCLFCDWLTVLWDDIGPQYQSVGGANHWHPIGLRWSCDSLLQTDGTPEQLLWLECHQRQSRWVMINNKSIIDGVLQWCYWFVWKRSKLKWPSLTRSGLRLYLSPTYNAVLSSLTRQLNIIDTWAYLDLATTLQLVGSVIQGHSHTL